MMPQKDLMSQAMHRYGSILRVTDPDESEIGFGATYVDENTTASVGTTRTPQHRFSVTVVPARPLMNAVRRSFQEYPVDVYLDGAFVGQGAWRRDLEDIWPDAWMASVRLGSDLEITVRAASETSALPTELTLVRDRPSRPSSTAGA